MSRYIHLLIPVLLFASCKPKAKQDIAFYYWKSAFTLNPTELSCLAENKSKTLYIKYFDVVKEEGRIKPVAMISFHSKLPDQKIIPVIFIKNEVFKNTGSIAVEKLARNTVSLIDQINFSNSITVQELQLDCDWTEKTKASYFLFLSRIKHLSRNTISATIRLHQIKYKTLTGIPPADKGVLMYYNMSDITPDHKNSIYDKNTANKYLNSLRTYPLVLDIALPIFSWGIQSREGKVTGLLNKMQEADLKGDPCFAETQPGHFSAKKACFKSGYYFQEGDQVKIEYVKQEELLQIAGDIKSNLSGQPSEIIFYDLDSLNLNRYDKSIFQKVLDRFR